VPTTPEERHEGGCEPSLWEHRYGVKIETLDNPGWRLAVDLAHTAYAGTPVDWTLVDRSEHDWVHWRVRDDRFEAACGPTNLNEANLAFLDFVGRRAT
jgi:hypothetical protein